MHQVWLWELYYAVLDMVPRTESPTEIREIDSARRHSEDSNHHAGDSAILMSERDLRLSTSPLVDVVIGGKVMSETQLLPCHYFDFMYGTSTGGLIATILGRLRMTVDEALALYRTVGDSLFGHRRSRIPLVTKYYHEPLEEAVKRVVADRCNGNENALYVWDVYDDYDPDESLDVDEPRVCQSCCLAAVHDNQITEAYMLRSYPYFIGDDAPNYITQYNEGAAKIPIWKVTRATTAAPFYFDMVSAEVEGKEMTFKDGGIRENNPSGAAMTEFRVLFHGGRHADRKADNPALLLSVGTGKGDTNDDGFSSWSGPAFMGKFFEKWAVIRNLLIKYVEGERQHHQLRETAEGENTWYKRLNVSTGLENMALDDWRTGSRTDVSTGKVTVVPGGETLNDMERVTNDYLTRGFDPEHDSYARPSIMLNQAAHKMVLQRRAREKMGGPRWDTFASRQ